MKKVSKKQQQADELEIRELFRKYPLIPAYSKIMGSYPYWTEQQLYLAKQIDAPVNTYRVDIGSLFSGKPVPPVAHTIDQISNQSLVVDLKQIASQYGYREEETNNG